jgi:hypothetical protein
VSERESFDTDANSRVVVSVHQVGLEAPPGDARNVNPL